MATARLIPDETHPEGGHAALEVDLAVPASVGAVLIQVQKNADKKWLQRIEGRLVADWDTAAEGRWEIDAGDVTASGNRLYLRLPPIIVNALAPGQGYRVNLLGRDGIVATTAQFRAPPTLRVGTDRNGGGNGVAGETTAPPSTARPSTRVDVVGDVPGTNTSKADPADEPPPRPGEPPRQRDPDPEPVEPPPTRLPAALVVEEGRGWGRTIAVASAIGLAAALVIVFAIIPEKEPPTPPPPVGPPVVQPTTPPASHPATVNVEPNAELERANKAFEDIRKQMRERPGG